MKVMEGADSFNKENACDPIPEWGEFEKTFCEAQVARTVIFYHACQSRLGSSKDYTQTNMSDDICREVRLLHTALDKYPGGGMKHWVPAPFLAKINKIVMDAR